MVKLHGWYSEIWSSIHLQACFFLHHKDSTSGMDANNTIHDDFTVAHLIILGEMYCSPIQLDISITEEDQGKYDRNIMGVDGLGCQMDGWMDTAPRCQAVGRTKAWVQVGLHTRRKSWKGLERTQDDRPRQHPICKKKWPSETLRNVKAQLCLYLCTQMGLNFNPGAPS